MIRRNLNRKDLGNIVNATLLAGGMLAGGVAITAMPSTADARSCEHPVVNNLKRDTTVEFGAVLPVGVGKRAEEAIIDYAADRISENTDDYEKRKFENLFGPVEAATDSQNDWLPAFGYLHRNDTPNEKSCVVFLVQDENRDGLRNKDEESAFHIPDHQFCGSNLAIDNSPYIHCGGIFQMYQRLVNYDIYSLPEKDPFVRPPKNVIYKNRFSEKQQKWIGQCIGTEIAKGMRRNEKLLERHQGEKFYRNWKRYNASLGNQHKPSLQEGVEIGVFVEGGKYHAMLFKDKNRNGKRERNEKLLYGIHASDDVGPYFTHCALAPKVKVAKRKKVRKGKKGKKSGSKDGGSAKVWAQSSTIGHCSNELAEDVYLCDDHYSADLAVKRLDAIDDLDSCLRASRHGLKQCLSRDTFAGKDPLESVGVFLNAKNKREVRATLEKLTESTEAMEMLEIIYGIDKVVDSALIVSPSVFGASPAGQGVKGNMDLSIMAGISSEQVSLLLEVYGGFEEIDANNHWVNKDQENGSFADLYFREGLDLLRKYGGLNIKALGTFGLFNPKIELGTRYHHLGRGSEGIDSDFGVWGLHAGLGVYSKFGDHVLLGLDFHQNMNFASEGFFTANGIDYTVSRQRGFSPSMQASLLFHYARFMAKIYGESEGCNTFPTSQVPACSSYYSNAQAGGKLGFLWHNAWFEADVKVRSSGFYPLYGYQNSLFAGVKVVVTLPERGANDLLTLIHL